MSTSVRSGPRVVAWRGRNRFLADTCAIENLLRESKNLVSECRGMQRAMTPRPLPDFTPIKYKKKTNSLAIVQCQERREVTGLVTDRFHPAATGRPCSGQRLPLFSLGPGRFFCSLSRSQPHATTGECFSFFLFLLLANFH